MSTRTANATRGARRRRERAARRAEVLAAARPRFAQKGYQGVTMLEIAAASELALGTLYQLFASKEEILCSLLEDYVDQLIARAREAMVAAPDAAGQLRRIVHAQLTFSEENVDVLRLYLSGWTGYQFSVRERFGDRIDTKYEEYLDLLTAVFRRGMREGRFATQPPRRLAVAVAGMIHALIRRWLRERSIRLVVEGDALVQVLVRGLAAGPHNGRSRR